MVPYLISGLLMTAPQPKYRAEAATINLWILVSQWNQIKGNMLA